MPYITTPERIGRAQGLEEGIRQGVLAGLKQGMEQGRIQGEAKVLMHLLTCKFGALPDDYRRQIEQADAEQLLAWSIKVLEASSLEEVFQD